MANGTNGHPVTRKKVKRFAEVVDILRDKGAPEGFRRCRDILFERAEELVDQMPLYNVLKLCIDFDRHALFAEVAQDKTRSAHDAEAYAAYQQYLAGTSDVPVAVGLPLGTKAQPAQPAEADEEEEHDE